MANGEYFSGGKPCNDAQIRKVEQLQGTAKAEPGQGSRTADSGSDQTGSLEGRGTMEQK